MFTEYSMINPREMAEYFGFTEKEVKKLCERFDRNFEETCAWYDGYELVAVDGKEKICYSMYSPKSVVDAMLSGVFDNYWNQTETYEALKAYIKLNFDGLKDAVIRMLAGEKVQINTGTFSNDMTSFQGKDDVLTLLIHLGYLSYHWPDKTVTIPNKEVSQEYINAISTMDWSEVTASIENQKLLKISVNNYIMITYKKRNRRTNDELFTRNYLSFIHQSRTSGCIARRSMAEHVSGFSGSSVFCGNHFHDYSIWNNHFEFTK